MVNYSNNDQNIDQDSYEVDFDDVFDGNTAVLQKEIYCNVLQCSLECIAKKMEDSVDFLEYCS